MWHAPQGVHDFLCPTITTRARLGGQQAHPAEIMVLGRAGQIPDLLRHDHAKKHGGDGRRGDAADGTIAANPWLSDRDLAFYSAEYARTGFQGGLQWYRCGTSGVFTAELETWSGRSIDVPSCFISGRQDWGIYQRPGVFEAMQASACTRMSAAIWSRAPDIGSSKSSRMKSAVGYCNS